MIHRAGLCAATRHTAWANKESTSAAHWRENHLLAFILMAPQQRAVRNIDADYRPRGGWTNKHAVGEAGRASGQTAIRIADDVLLDHRQLLRPIQVTGLRVEHAQLNLALLVLFAHLGQHVQLPGQWQWRAQEECS